MGNEAQCPRCGETVSAGSHELLLKAWGEHQRACEQEDES